MRQSELGDIVFVDIDPDLAEINKGETLGTIEAVKTVSDLLSPCSGKVIEINTAFSRCTRRCKHRSLREWMDD